MSEEDQRIPDFDPAALAKELREARDSLIELLRTLPESRAYRATERAGWTIKHEMAALGAADAELVHILDELKRRSGTLTFELRRRRAESMHGLQNLRLSPLIEALERGGARAVDAITEHGHHFTRSVHVGRPNEGSEPTPAAQLAHAYRERVHGAIEALRKALG